MAAQVGLGEMKQVNLAVTMLRYRVASLLLPFLLLAPALHSNLQSFRWTYVAAVVALFSSYIVATCLNDVFDLEVDRINHPHAPDRPLVTGQATPRQLVVVAIACAALALAAAVASGPLGIALIVTSLLLNVAYSAPPIRLCGRALAAPLVLAFAYVAIPYGLGLAAVGRWPEWFDVRVVLCFCILFTGRMLLKDFRDRKGDAQFGKRTFLLAYGKRATLIAVLICVVAGDAVLLSAMPANFALTVITEAYFVAIVQQLYRLWQAGNLDEERTAIALGARMGNAVVLTLLGFALLQEGGATSAERTLFVLVLAALFWIGFASASSKPREAVSAYRG